jgi:hypothetical protein
MADKRLGISLSEPQHKAIKHCASITGQSMKDYVLSKVFGNRYNRTKKETEKSLQQARRVEGLSVYNNMQAFLSQIKPEESNSIH